MSKKPFKAADLNKQQEDHDQMSLVTASLLQAQNKHRKQSVNKESSFCQNDGLPQTGVPVERNNLEGLMSFNPGDTM